MALKVARADVWATSIEDRPGGLAEKLAVLAGAGVNLRGLFAAAIGPRCVVHLALDSTADATKASRVLKRL